MRTEIEQLLPQVKSGEISKAEVEEIKNKIRMAIKDDPSKGKEYGQLIPLLNEALQAQVHSVPINWVSVVNGALAIGHKPGGKISFEGMKASGVSVVLTLLKENEGARPIGDHLKKAGIDWIWYPFSASKPGERKDKTEVLELLEKLEALLKSGSRIYVHCSAGIHRTGMITYALLRYLGNEKTEALQLLNELRDVTAAQVGEERLVWGDQFFINRGTK